MGRRDRNTISKIHDMSSHSIGVHVETIAVASDLHDLDKAEIAEIERAAIAREEDEALSMTPAEHRKLIRRIDIAIIPYCTILFALSAIDRINIGQAAVAGLSKDLHMSSQTYQIALSIFFVTYTFAEIPANVILKKVAPHIWITFIMIVWSICTVTMGLCKNGAGLIVARIFLGFAEGGLFPGISYMLSCWYTREELSLRVSLFFLGATLSGAFGGILAFALRQMDGVGGKPGWAWIFIIEGLVTFIVACTAWWAIRDFPEESNLLNEQEREKWLYHLRKSSGMAAAQLPFSYDLVFRPLKEWQLWVYCLMYIGIATPQFSLGLFTPTILAELGYKGTKANLMSAPPWAFAFFCLIAVSWWSDRLRLRGPFIVVCMSLITICYGVLCANVSAHTKYAMIFLCCGGASCSVAIGIAWIGGNIGPALSRASAMGMYFAIGNAGGLISSNIYPAKTGPKFIEGHAVNLAVAGMSVICAIILSLDHYRINRSRDKQFGKPAPFGVDCSPTHADDPAIKEKYQLPNLSKEEILALGHHHPAFRFTI